MIKYLFTFIAINFYSYSICPMCTFTAGATFAIARYLGITDLSTGILIAAFLFSSSEWFKSWLIEKKFNKYSSFLVSYLMHFGSIYFIYKKYAYNSIDMIFNMNTFLFGLLVGLITSIASQIIYKYMKEKNNDKPYFPFQKVVMLIFFNIGVAAFFRYIR